jgi:hypothetical protein
MAFCWEFFVCRNEIWVCQNDKYAKCENRKLLTHDATISFGLNPDLRSRQPRLHPFSITRHTTEPADRAIRSVPPSRHSAPQESLCIGLTT